jgi:hypothetical protein
MAQVEQFSLGWHPKSGSAYRIKPVGGSWSPWIGVPAAELAVLAAIFREQPVFIHPNGSITTGPEQIGD